MDVKHLAMEKFIPKERILNAHFKLQKNEKENKVAKNHIDGIIYFLSMKLKKTEKAMTQRRQLAF